MGDLGHPADSVRPCRLGADGSGGAPGQPGRLTAPPSGVGPAGEVVVVLAAPSRGRRPVKIGPMLEVAEHDETLE
jgi:hypothetical protein